MTTVQAKNLRKSILKIAFIGQDANLQSLFSSVEILRVLYDRIMNVTHEEETKRDRFVLSKGQSTMALLALLAEKGILDSAELKTACQYDASVSMQADRTKLSCMETSAGSLGHGLPMAVGMAWGNKLKGSTGRVFVLAGDGEMNEGTMWEAILFAASEKLDNLTLIIDDNDSIGKMISMGDLAQKLSAFGFVTVTVDGHDEDALEQSLKTPHAREPLAVIAKTIRGYGSKTIMTDASWFHRAPNRKEFDELCAEVDHFDKM